MDHDPDPTTAAELHAYLHSLSRTQLLDLLLTLAATEPGVADYLQRRRQLGSGQHAELVQAAGRELQRFAQEGADLAPLRDYLHALLAAGHADAVLDVGERLLALAPQRLEAEDESESLPEIAACLHIVFAALPHSTLPVTAQMQRAVRLELNDPYNCCQQSGVFWAGPFSSDDWSHLADALLQDLARASSHSPYERDRLTDRLIDSLERAGRSAEILPLCAQEAPLTGSYLRLVERLLQANRREEALLWLQRGIPTDQSGVVRRRLVHLYEQEADWPQVAALRADEFFAQPSYGNYQAVQIAAEQAGCWPSVRPLALAYLESGQRDPAAPWPLPPAVVAAPVQRGQARFPAIDTLIDVALAEQRPLDALHWYEQRPRTPFGGFYGIVDKGAVIAAAITASQPDKAIAIWRSQAESAIAQTRQSAYQEAVATLANIRELLHSIGRDADWRALLADIRQQHARKRTLLALLDRL